MLHGTADWVLLNVVAVVMALAGIEQGWRWRSRGGCGPGRPWLVVPVVWVSGGFLVSMLPYLIVSSLLARDAEVGGRPGLAGLGDGVHRRRVPRHGAGVVVGLPRSTFAVGGRAFIGKAVSRAAVGAGAGPVPVDHGTARGARRTVDLPQAAGGTMKPRPVGAAGGGADARLLLADSALCAVCGVWSLWALSGRGGARTPSWLPVALGFIASGSLFAWGSWKLLWRLLPPGHQRWPMPLAGAGRACRGRGAGLAIVVTLVRSTRPAPGGS